VNTLTLYLIDILNLKISKELQPLWPRLPIRKIGEETLARRAHTAERVCFTSYEKRQIKSAPFKVIRKSPTKTPSPRLPRLLCCEVANTGSFVMAYLAPSTTVWFVPALTMGAALVGSTIIVTELLAAYCESLAHKRSTLVPLVEKLAVVAALFEFPNVHVPGPLTLLH